MTLDVNGRTREREKKSGAGREGENEREVTRANYVTDRANVPVQQCECILLCAQPRRRKPALDTCDNESSLFLSSGKPELAGDRTPLKQL